MKQYLYPILVILVALVSVGLSEIFLVTWLSVAPMDVTANIFWLGILPAEIILVAITTGLLFKVYKFKPLVYMPLYLVVFVGVHTFELYSFFNPWRDIAMYIMAILIACALWFYVATRAFRN